MTKILVAFALAAFSFLAHAQAPAQTFQAQVKNGALGFYTINGFQTDGFPFFHDGSATVTGSRSSSSSGVIATGIVAVDHTPRTIFMSPAGANQTAGLRLSNPAGSGGSLWIGSGGLPRQGGFRYLIRSGITPSAGGSNASGMLFVLAMLTQDTTITTTNDPSTEVTNAFYIGLDKTETTLEACSCGAATPCVCTSTGMTMVNGNAHLYDVEFDCTNGIPCEWMITDVITETEASGTFSSNAADNPATNAFFDERFYCATGAIANACQLWVSQITAERSYF